MKKYIFLTIITTFALLSFSFAQLKVSSTGNVGINNNSPLYRLDVDGTVRFKNWTDIYIDWTSSGTFSGLPVMYPKLDWYFQLGTPTKKISGIYLYKSNSVFNFISSDDSIKTNKAIISDPISKIKALKGWQYNFTDSFLSNIPDSCQADFNHVQYGFMAREVNLILPEIVSHDVINDKYSVNYTAVIPLLTEAVKIQQTNLDNMTVTISNQEDEIRNLTSNLNRQNTKISELTDAIAALQNCCNNGNEMQVKPQGNPNNIGSNNTSLNLNNVKSIDISENRPILYQNSPNPFNESTEVKFYLPDYSKTALIIIYNLTGEQLQSYNITSKGTQSIKIDGSILKPGSYYYTLIVDNNEIDTKKMILVK